MVYGNYKKILAPTAEQIADVTDGLHRFGLAQTGGATPARIAIVCENENGESIGGAVGHSLLDRFYLTQLWVAEEFRLKGIGTELVMGMEAAARERNCKDVVLDTLNARSVPFYQRLGFNVYLVNSNYIAGFDWYFLSKEVA